MDAGFVPNDYPKYLKLWKPILFKPKVSNFYKYKPTTIDFSITDNIIKPLRVNLQLNYFQTVYILVNSWRNSKKGYKLNEKRITNSYMFHFDSETQEFYML